MEAKSDKDIALESWVTQSISSMQNKRTLNFMDSMYELHVWINWCINAYHFHFDFKLQLRLPFPGPSTQWPIAPRLRRSWRCGHGIKSVDKTEKKTPPDFTVKFDTASAAFTTTFTVKGNHSPQMLRQLQRPFTALLTGSWWTKLASSGNPLFGI